MKVLGIIPAHLQSKRLPGKLLEDVGGKPLIVRTYEAACKIKCLDEVIVVTDDPSIAKVVKDHKGLVWRSGGFHQSGSDRVADYVAHHECDIAINIPGDMPFLGKTPVEDLVRALKESSIKVGTLKKKISNEEELFNTDIVKVVCDKNSDALYFSRALIPHFRLSLPKFNYHKHINIFGFKRDALLKFSRWGVGELENVEDLEQLRLLENGVKLRVVATDEDIMTVETAYDLEQANIYYESNNRSRSSNRRTKEVCSL